MKENLFLKGQGLSNFQKSPDSTRLMLTLLLGGGGQQTNDLEWIVPQHALMESDHPGKTQKELEPSKNDGSPKDIADIGRSQHGTSQNPKEAIQDIFLPLCLSLYQELLDQFSRHMGCEFRFSPKRNQSWNRLFSRQILLKQQAIGLGDDER
jgi:hypothetical protein